MRTYTARENKARGTQTPRMTNNMGTKVLYLEPGIDMRKPGEHPDNLTIDVRSPNPSVSTISWLPGMYVQ